MNLEELMASTPPMQQHALIKGFQAGAASRDAEVAKANSVSELGHALFAKQLIENDQLRAQINVLREALEHSVLYVPDLATVPGIAAALAATPEQSLARIRNQVREDIAREFDGEVWAYDYREIAARIRAMKELQQ